MTTSALQRTRLYPEQRRKQIIQSAQGLFGERPYNAVSMSDIARAAGVTRALVHHYFATKRDLYRAVIESLVDAGPRVVRTDLAVPVDQVAAANLSSALDLAQHNRETLLAIAHPGRFDDDPELVEVIDRARETLVDRILLNHLGSTDVPEEARMLIRAYLGLFEAATREWLQQGRATREATHLLLTRALVAMMRDTLPALLELADRPS